MNLASTSFPVVTSLDNLEVGRIYTTYNPKILKPLKYNRGTKEGYVRQRVNAIKKMIDNNENPFFFDVCHVTLNLEGRVIDGNNRKKALAEKGKPINFMILAQAQFNLPDESEILNNVSDYNAINSSWSDNDAYISAFTFGEKTATTIDKIKTSLENEHGMPNTMFTPGRLVALAQKSKGGLGGRKQTRRTYCDTKLNEIMSTNEYQKLLDFCVSVIKFAQKNNPSIEPWFVVRGLLPSVWENDLNYNIVLKHLRKTGLKNLTTTLMKGVRERCVNILMSVNIEILKKLEAAR